MKLIIISLLILPHVFGGFIPFSDGKGDKTCKDTSPLCASPFAQASCKTDMYFRHMCCATCTPPSPTPSPDEPANQIMPLMTFIQALDPGCVDKAAYCGMIVSMGKMSCMTDPALSMNCPYSCGKCPALLAATYKQELAVAAPAPAGVCKDTSPFCTSMFSSFACMQDPMFKKDCALSCGICTPAPAPTPAPVVMATAPKQGKLGCFDSSPICKTMPTVCMFPGFKGQCAKSCGTCEPPKPDSPLMLIAETGLTPTVGPLATAAVPEPLAPTTPEPVCADLLPAAMCKSFWAQFACADNTTEFHNKCRASCGECVPEGSTAAPGVPANQVEMVFTSSDAQLKELFIQTTSTTDDKVCKDKAPASVCSSPFVQTLGCKTDPMTATMCCATCSGLPLDSIYQVSSFIVQPAGQHDNTPATAMEAESESSESTDSVPAVGVVAILAGVAVVALAAFMGLFYHIRRTNSYYEEL